MAVNNQITQISTPRRCFVNLPGGTTAGTVFTLMPAATFWAQNTFYALDSRVVANDAVYRCTGSGTSANAGGPSGQNFSITNDGTVTWSYEGTGWGWKVKGLMAKSSDNTNNTAIGLQLVYNSLIYPLWSVQLAIALAPPQAVWSVASLMQGAATIPPLPKDSTGTPYFYMDVFDALQVVSLNGVASGAGISATVSGVLEAW